MINVKLGDVVLIGDSKRNRGKRNMGIVVKLFQGRDGVVRAVRLRAENRTLNGQSSICFLYNFPVIKSSE